MYKDKKNHAEAAKRYRERKKAEKQAAMEQQKLALLKKPEEELTLQQAVNRDDISGRTRTWLFLVYPTKEMCDAAGLSYDGSSGYGSAPDDWRTILDKFHVPWVESPLHDSDLNADLTEKKPHWHIMLLFDSVKSYEQVTVFSKSVNGSFPVKCRSMRGSLRYFYHADNPEKAQYDKKDIKGHCGADLDKLLELSDSEKSFLLNQIFDFIVENDVVEYAHIVDYARLWRSDWYDLIVHHYTMILKSYLQSRRNSDMRVRYYVGEDGKLVDTGVLTYDQRIQNLLDEVDRLREEQAKLLAKNALVEKVASVVYDNPKS